MVSVREKNVPFALKLRKAALYMQRNGLLYVMLLLPVAFFVLFRYVPMVNIVIAFKDYNLFQGTWASEWIRPWYAFFAEAFNSRDFWLALRNTLVLNGLDLIIGFPAPIILALLLNEVAYRRYKRVSQTILYLPHFLSWIIIAGIAFQIFAPLTGLINIFFKNIGLGDLLVRLGITERDYIPFLDKAGMWIFTYILLGLWQSIGWNTIIYLAAITGVSPELYEAAESDGAGRLRKIWHVTLPGIMPTIAVLLILSLGRILNIEIDRPYALGTVGVRNVADVISTYVYRVGIQSMHFSLAAAVGIFQSMVCVFFLVIANAAIEKTGQKGIW
jgi:putative aldouronate transport system permease protein